MLEIQQQQPSLMASLAAGGAADTAGEGSPGNAALLEVLDNPVRATTAGAPAKWHFRQQEGQKTVLVVTPAGALVEVV